MKYLYILFLLLFSFSAIGNNIRVEGKTRVVEFLGSDTAVVEVTLLWDNSWRDDFNWDATWVFFKYKKRGMSEEWKHVYLNSSGHNLVPESGNEGSGYSCMVGVSSGKVTGLYVMRDGISEGKVKVRLQVKWPLSGTGLSRSDFGENLDQLYVAVHATEMVYIPYGAYSAGDAYSYRSFAVADTASLIVDSEDALNVSVREGGSYSLTASYPKGYAGFYVMKYEVSQEQYTEFLNSLTLGEQKLRVANNDFARMKQGDYVFGDLERPSCRNGIAFFEQKKADAPVVFGNNLNPANGFFSADDGQTLACNYMSVEDMLAYCSWSGLRPMSELEYEKACRRFYPQVPEKGEYAWNASTGVDRLSSMNDLSYAGAEQEQTLSYTKNVNSGTGNTINGPVRCGLFATSSTNQMQAGATYWGVMEMSGNVKELCVNVTYTNFDGGSSGQGICNPNLWNRTDASKYGVRGGGFNSADNLLRTSDRSEATNYFSVITDRDSTVGFRGVYSLSGIAIDGGKLRAPETLCVEEEVNILSVQAASCPDFPEVRFQYNWYVKKPGEAKFELIENAAGESLTYREIHTGGTWEFKRTGICSMGEASVVFLLTVPNMNWNITPLISTIDACGNSNRFTATSEVSGAAYEWLYNGSILSTANTYKPELTEFESQSGDCPIICRMSRTGCTVEKTVTVRLPHIEIVSSANVTLANCGAVTFRDERDGKSYCTVKIGSQCWMGTNLNYGVLNSSKYCYNNTESNCDQYGGMYTWAMAMNNFSASELGVRGICPAGWHIPSPGEWNTLERNWKATWNVQKGGHRIASLGGAFRGLGSTGCWWATQVMGAYAGFASGGAAPSSSYDYASGIYKYPTDWNSVRCLKD